MVVSSFFPGHIRIRDAVLKDEQIAFALKTAVESHKAVRRVEYNTKTGSALVEYDPDKISLQKFKLLKKEIIALKQLCDFYTGKKKDELLAAMENIILKLNGHTSR